MLTRLALVSLLWAAVLLPMSSEAGGVPKPASKNAEAQKLIDKYWTLIHTDETIEIYKQALATMQQADRIDPNNVTILVELARAYWDYGNILPKKTEAQQKIIVPLYLKGVDAADKSLNLKETVGGHYWLAVNKATSLEFSNMLSQAAAFPSLYSHAQKVKQIERDYYYGAGGRFWTELLSRIPKKVVEIVGWDVQEAVDEIDHAIKVEPRYLDNYVYKARFMFVYFENKEEALKLLAAALSKDPNIMPEEVCANRSSQRHGRELWKQITGKEYPQK